jgi:hypothetical protein
MAVRAPVNSESLALWHCRCRRRAKKPAIQLPKTINSIKYFSYFLNYTIPIKKITT